MSHSSDPELPPDFKLELVADDFTDEAHQTLDAELGSTTKWSRSDIASSAPMILYILVKQLGGRASEECQTLEYCQKLITENPVLVDMLVTGKQRGFKLVRRLKILRDVPVTPGKSLNENAIAHTAKSAWDLEYQGQYAQILWDNINDLPRAASHPNYAPIIQSSGYGKSRMVDELAKFVFTIPFNIQKPGKQTTGDAYPPSDPDVWEYLCTLNAGKAHAAESIAASFFGSLFQHVADEVWYAFHGRDKVPPDSIAREWQKHLLKPTFSSTPGTIRSRLYKKVVLTAAQTCEEFPVILREAVRNKLHRLLNVLSRVCFDLPPDKHGKDRVRIILYFDQAHELGQDIGKGKNFYGTIRSILEEFTSPHVFSIFISTHSDINPPPPHEKTSSSSRQQDVDEPLCPINEMPFDCHPIFPLHLRQYGLADVSRLPFMMRFGRPLFWTMFEQKEHMDKEHLEDMMCLARKKLLFEDDIHSEPSAVDRNARIAILDVLITLDYERKWKSAHQLEMRLVANHMRTVFSIPGHRMYVYSGYPSEPFLAEAASRQMHHFMQADSGFQMIGDLDDMVQEGLVDLDRKGEMVMRLLLRRAYMDAVVEEQGAEHPNFSRGCSFITFLGALLAAPHDTAVQDCKPDNVAGNLSAMDLAVVFKDAIVRFTHFAKAGEGGIMTTRGMAMGFLRGAAMIGWYSRKEVDVAIPILMNKDAKIEEESMSALLIQVKPQHQGSVKTYSIDATKIDFFPEDAVDHPRPYVTLIAELSARAPATLEATVKFGEPPQHVSPRRLEEEPPHPRYSIWAYQCIPRTWKVVSNAQHYNNIVALDDLFGDHPRQNEASLELVHQMLLIRDSDSATNWVSVKSEVAMEPVSGGSELVGPSKKRKID